MAYFTPNKALNSPLYILPYKLKLSLHHVHLLLIKTIFLKSLTLKSSLVNLMIPHPRSYPVLMALFRPIPKTSICLYSCLISFMNFLQNTTNTFLSLTENLKTLKLRNIYKLFNIFSIFLR